ARGSAWPGGGGGAPPGAGVAGLWTAPAGLVTEVHRYLVAGGPANVEQMLRFVADTVLVGGFGFEPPRPIPRTGVWDGAGTASARTPARPLVGVVFYRAHLVAGNTQFVADLSAALDPAGADTLPAYCSSLRPDAEGRVEALELCRDRGVDALVTTVLAMGAAGEGDAEDWQVPQLAELGVPVIQAPSCNRSRGEWIDDDAGLTPLDL